MKLAELCDVAPSYIGQIEIGRRFPSLPLIEKIGRALEVEPYRFFIEESGKNNTELDEAIDLLAKLPDQVRLHAINRISAPLEQPPLEPLKKSV
jgi:transcriptional regulator with XRE-family HTH domain